MYKYCLLFLLIVFSYAAPPGQDLCTIYTTETNCKNSGYCKWSTTCGTYTMPQDCYRINEIGACRSSGVYASNCYAITSLNVQYENVCTPNSNQKIDYNYVRFPISNTGLATHSLTGITVADLGTKTPQADYLYQVFTVNIQLATNSQLNAILGLYKLYEPELIKTTTHPYYIEKALFQTIQNIRDDTVIDATAKGVTMVAFWDLCAIFLKRVQTFSKHYQTNYYILNFAQTTFSRLYLTINGQEHTTTFSWLSYTKNGYVQVISYPAAQFGITFAGSKAISDVYYVKIIDDSAVPGAPYNSLALTVTYINSGSQVVTATDTLIPISNKAAGTYTAGTPLVASSVDTASKKLVFAPASASEYVFYIQTT